MLHCGKAFKKAVVASAAAAMLVVGASASEPAPGQPLRGVFLSGTDAVEGSLYSYYGVIAALNRDLSRDGWLVRLYGSLDDYDTDPGDGRGWQADLMVGYYITRGAMWASLMVGVDYQNFDDDALGSEVQGTEFGFKIAADVSTADGSPFYAAVSANYSTAFDTYWVRGRVGMHRDRVTFGPEGIVYGNDDFDAQRLGAFVTFHDLNPFRFRPFDMTLSAGHQFVSGDSTGGSGGEEGIYGAISFSTLF
jgi:Cellulose biosynthesis protein BcsS